MKQMLFVLALASGCVEATDDVSVAESDQPAFVLLGNIYQNGTKVSFENITRISGFDTTKLAGLTACDPKALYAVEAQSKKIYFSNTYGQSWTFTTRMSGVGCGKV